MRWAGPGSEAAAELVRITVTTCRCVIRYLLMTQSGKLCLIRVVEIIPILSSITSIASITSTATATAINSPLLLLMISIAAC